jgi:RND family efflux transporter, MFP subunit
MIVLAAFGCSKRNELATPPPPTVSVATPILRPVQRYFETTGQTSAAQTVDLRARVGGYLKEIRFKDGQLVKEGDVLFVIDQETYIAAVNSAKANLKRAEAQLLLAEQQLARTEVLARDDAATASSLDIQKAERDTKAAEVDAAKAALRDAELNLGYTVITAPFAGRMGRHLVDIGNLIVAGQTLLASLESVDPMYAYFTLSESDLLRFLAMQKEGKLKPITEADPIQFELALGETRDFRFVGYMDFRKFGINPGTGTAERRAVFPNKDESLMPGLFVRLRAKLGDPRPYLMVDEQAIGRNQRGDYVLIVNDKNVVEMRPVVLGPVDKGLQAIESGIQETDRVVVIGLMRARPGIEVNPELVPMDRTQKSSPPQTTEGDGSGTTADSVETKTGEEPSTSDK